MARTMETMMCVALLGFMTFSLQGCEEAAKDHLEQYKQAAAGFVADATSSAATAALKQSGACPPLHAGVQKQMDELVSVVADKIVLGSTVCNKGMTIDPSEECAKFMSFELADRTLFSAERDPLFIAWTEKYEDKWNKFKSTVNSVLSGELLEPIKVMQASSDEGGPYGSLNWIKWAKVQFTEILNSVLPVFCPAGEDEVAGASAKDEPLVAQQAKADAAAAVAKQEAFKQEVAEEEAAKTVRRLVDDIAV